MADESPNQPPKKPEDDKPPEPSDNPADQSPGMRSQLGRWRPRRNRAGTTEFYVNLLSGQPILQPTLTPPSTIPSEGSSNMPVFRISLQSGSSRPPQVVSTAGYRRRSLSEVSIANWSGEGFSAGHDSSRPSSGHDSSSPNSEHDSSSPSSGNDTLRPGSEHGSSSPSSGHDTPRPGSEHNSPRPGSGHGSPRPGSGHGSPRLSMGHGSYRPSSGHNTPRPGSGHDSPRLGSSASVMNVRKDSVSETQSVLSQDTIGAMSVETLEDTMRRFWELNYRPPLPRDQLESMLMESNPTRPWRGSVDSIVTDSTLQHSASIVPSAQTAPRMGPDGASSSETDTASQSTVREVAIPRLESGASYFADSSASSSSSGPVSSASLRTASPSLLERRMEAVNVARLGRRLGFPAPPSESSTSMSHMPDGSESSLDAISVAMSGSLVEWNPSSSDLTGGRSPPGWLVEELAAVGGEAPRVQRGRRRSSSASFPYVRWGSPSSGEELQVVAPGDERDAEAGPQFYISSGQSDRGSQAEESDASDPPAQNPFRAVQMERGSSDTLTASESESRSGSTSSRSFMDPGRHS